MADDKITADNYFEQYGINPDVARADLTDEDAIAILEKAAKALKSQKDKMEIVESVKDGAFEVLKVLKVAGTVAAILL